MPNKMKRRELGYEPIGEGIKVSAVLIYDRELTPKEKKKVDNLINKLRSI